MDRFIDNSPDRIKLRKHQNTLVVVGVGVIAMGIEYIFELLGLMLFDREYVANFFREMNPEFFADFSDGFMILLFAIFALIVLFLTVSVRVFVGVNAIKEGKGGKPRFLYLVFTAILIASTFESIMYGLEFLKDAENNSVRLDLLFNTAADSTNGAASISTLLICIISLVLLTELVYASIMSKILRRKMQCK
ncbi:MAG: hypothetical protein IJ619_01190 [Eubacterium sp.]|nr:hypothetical protein [Eubacterium sp.]